MRLMGVMLVVGLVAMVSASAALGADMMAAAKTELGTALTHAGFAAGYDAVAEVELHLHHVVNCLEGAAGKNYNMGAGNVCQGQGPTSKTQAWPEPMRPPTPRLPIKWRTGGFSRRWQRISAGPKQPQRPRRQSFSSPSTTSSRIG